MKTRTLGGGEGEYWLLAWSKSRDPDKAETHVGLPLPSKGR
jgi:hypothetical protein